MTQTATSITKVDMPLGANRKSRKPTCSSFARYSEAAIWAPRRAQFCLTYQGQYLLDQTDQQVSDQSNWLTTNPSESLKFMDQDVAITRAQALQQQGIAVEIKLVRFQYVSGGVWKVAAP